MKAPPTTLCKSVLLSYVQKRCSISCCIVLALDRARCTQANDSAGTYFNSPSSTQTKCRNELSLQSGKAISELGLDFVIRVTSPSMAQVLNPQFKWIIIMLLVQHHFSYSRNFPCSSHPIQPLFFLLQPMCSPLWLPAAARMRAPMDCRTGAPAAGAGGYPGRCSKGSMLPRPQLKAWDLTSGYGSVGVFG